MTNRATPGRVKRQYVNGEPVKQVKHRAKREPRSVIISFRLRESEAQLLRQDMEVNPSAGVRSLKQFARKLTIDYARGRMAYVDELDRLIDPYSRDNEERPIPACELKDAVFLAALDKFLSVENWRKLRFFMLLAGWPSHQIERYKKAGTDAERLAVVRSCLRDIK